MNNQYKVGDKVLVKGEIVDEYPGWGDYRVKITRADGDYNEINLTPELFNNSIEASLRERAEKAETDLALLKQEIENPTRTGACEVCHDKSVHLADKLMAENKRLEEKLEEAGLQACNDEAEIRWLEAALREIADQAGTTRNADWARRKAAEALEDGEEFQEDDARSIAL